MVIFLEIIQFTCYTNLGHLKFLLTNIYKEFFNKYVLTFNHFKFKKTFETKIPTLNKIAKTKSTHYYLINGWGQNIDVFLQKKVLSLGSDPLPLSKRKLIVMRKTLIVSMKNAILLENLNV